jgi:hypothetical protein
MRLDQETNLGKVNVISSHMGLQAIHGNGIHLVPNSQTKSYRSTPQNMIGTAVQWWEGDMIPPPHIHTKRTLPRPGTVAVFWT